MAGQDAKQTLTEKLEYLRSEYAKCSDAAQRFKIEKDFEETRELLSALGVVAPPLRRHLRAKRPCAGAGYNQRLKSWLEKIENALDNYARQTDWSSEYFAPLQVEVEEAGSPGRARADLLSMFRRHRRKRTLRFWQKNPGEIIRLTGDPGSGKSVALRRLCQDLLAEWRPGTPVPLYISLREWHLPKDWSSASPPAQDTVIRSLRDFILDYARSEIGDDKFIDDCLSDLIDRGTVFLLLDGFDEIGTVLNEADGSKLIDVLSRAIFAFLQDPCGGRGILASRRFRSPTLSFRQHAHFKILPMSNERVDEFIKRRIGPRGPVVKEYLHQHRSELVPIARNPFFAMLLVEYVRRNLARATVDDLPADKATFYSSFIDSRLADVTDMHARLRSTDIPRLIEACRRLAYHMIDSATLDLPRHRVLAVAGLQEDELACLAEAPGAKLLRIGPGTEPMVSFVHRKFAEYFAAQIQAREPHLPTDSIPRDSAWRDTLVMVCEIVELQRAQRLANECWDTLSRGYLAGKDEARRDAIHYFRFLIDAFGTRREACVDFKDAMGEQIFKRLRGRDLVPARFMVELAGILKPSNLANILSEVIGWNNRLINQPAFWSCRNLEQPDDRINHQLAARLAALPPFHHLTRGRELQKSLAWSNAFRTLRPFNRWLWIEDVTLTLCLTASVIVLLMQLLGGNLVAGTLLLLGPAYVLLNVLRAIGIDLRGVGRPHYLGLLSTRPKARLLSDRAGTFGLAALAFALACLFLLPPFGLFLLLHAVGVDFDAAIKAFRIYAQYLQPLAYAGLMFGPYLVAYLVRNHLSPPLPDVAAAASRERAAAEEVRKKLSKKRTSERVEARTAGEWLPWYRFRKGLRELVANIRNAGAELLSTTVAYLVLGLALGLLGGAFAGVSWVFGLIFPGLFQWPSRTEVTTPDISWEKLGVVLGVGFLIALVLAAVYGVVRVVVEIILPWVKDGDRLHKVIIPENPCCAEIEAELDALQTKGGKRRYLQRLDKEVTLLQGDWKYGRPPKTGCDELDTLLAELEIRWLGISR
ncbi:NACHT domain-containing NTPase [Thiohalocapsa sp. ML1]|jgi:hypothetical protein|uniref:NACHT domain-containing protein n=1 Tax=Thiohalocapsa sp. ML1 TaxID=1431688 RepID=UPI000732193D|nr:NACHT domain-containing protein [Thiohalocapsa sp. ML1]